MFKKEPLQLWFLLRRVYDLLPTPVNLKRWYKTTDEDCALCKKKSTLEHVLSSSKTTLTQGRYRWRHDRVLEALASILDPITKTQKRIKPLRFINFVKPGAIPKKTLHRNTDNSE